MTFLRAFKYVVESTGLAKGVEYADRDLRVCNRSYTYAIAEGDVTGHTTWSKIGFNPSVTTSEEDVWSNSSMYTFPTAAGAWEILSSNNTDDIGTVIHSGTNTDAGGSTTTLVKTGENFLTTTAAGDLVIVDAGGTTPEWGWITAVDSDTQITFSGGLSSGGTGASRSTYSIVDYSATAGAHAVYVEGLDANYATQYEVGILNGTTVVALTKTWFRVNGFRMIGAGANVKPTGNLTVRGTGGGTVYSYILAGFTRARNIIYTVPAGKTLFVHTWHASAATSNDTKFQSCRIYTRANVYPGTQFLTGSIFYPYSEMLLTNESEEIIFQSPTKLPAKADIRVTALGLTGFSGSVFTALRGWLE